ncbi:MAG: hypothetical protein ABJQ23_05925, partial [Shimia thalassica]
MTTKQDETLAKTASKHDVRKVLETASEQVLVLDTEFLTSVKLPDGANIEFPFILDNQLILLQPDGTLIVFPNAAESSLLIDTGSVLVPITRLIGVATAEEDWGVLEDVAEIPLHFIVNPGTPVWGSADERELIVEDPLIGLDINPLLPPTGYAFGTREDREYGGDDDGSTTADLEITLTAPFRFSETDAAVQFRPTDHIDFTFTPQGTANTVTEVRLQIDSLPSGTQVSAGQLVAQPDGTFVLEFVGTLAEFDALDITLPTDFSSASRSDIASGPLLGSVDAVSNAGETATLRFPVRVTPEGDVEIDTSQPDTVPDETDAATPVVPADLLLPAVTDADGSEALQ